MEAWAASPLGRDCTFACVSVDRDAEGTARAFVEQLGLRHTTVGFVEHGAAGRPRFPCQLGCQGFVVLDAHLRFVPTATTPSYGRQGPVGFDAAEAVVRAAAERCVRVKGQRAVELPDEEVSAGHTAVRLESGEVLAVPSASLAREPLSETTEPTCPFADSEQPEGCGGACASRKRKLDDSDAPPAAGHTDEEVEDEDLPMVGHAVMDAEHNALGAALRGATTPAALAAAVAQMEEHFAHEEALMRDVGFGGSDGGDDGTPSARAGHVADHERIRDLAAAAVMRAVAAEALAPSDVKAILAAVADHTRRYDTLYAPAVAAATAA